MKKGNQKWVYFIASLLFSIGVVLILVNGYYDYQHSVLIIANRKDLIPRLSFLSYLNGFIFFPFTIIPVLLLTYFTNKGPTFKQKHIWIYASIGFMLIGIVFYTKVFNNQIDLVHRNWEIGIALIVIALFFFMNKQLFRFITTDSY